jgi:very-short-patch-repair endonuclease/DNA-directed RNA polymerase subunit RPC12/RpoP
MNDIFICKHCGKEMGIKQFGRHLWKIHNQKYEDYVLEHLEEFKHLNWKLCSECGHLFRGTSLKCGECYTKNHQIKKDQYIQCHYCGQSIHSKVISIHLKTYHNVEFLDYVKENLKDFEKMEWCKCVVCDNVCRNRSVKHNEPTCSTECMAKLRTSYIGKKSPRFGAILSDETKNKISVGNIGKEGLKGDLNPSCRKEVREQISKTRIERGVAKGPNNPMFGKTHTPEAIKNILSHRPMNKLEKIVADELDKNNILYHFQYFITEDGICKSYDFKIKEKPLILEVDGDFWHGNPNTKNHHIRVNNTIVNDKLKEEIASKRGIKVIRLWESDIKKDPSIVIRTLNPYIYT